MKIKIFSKACLIVACSFLILRQACAEPPTANGCMGRELEAGTGGDINKTVRSLHIDLDHGISMIYFPGHPLFPAYAISLVPAGKNWSLTYSVAKAKFASGLRAFRVTVPLSITWSDMAQRIADAWDRAIAGADASSAERNKSLNCLTADASGYVFSSNGRSANIVDPLGNIPAQLFDITDTLRLLILDTKNTGYPVGLTIDHLQQQLARVEGDLKVDSRH